MIDGLRVIAVITARGGSKGLPGKNIRPFAGRPLIAWSVAQARSSRYIDRVVVTSDDQAIIAAAVEAGAEAPFVRPAELSGDHAASVPVVLHAIDELRETADLVVLLQPTSPLRRVADIDGALRTCLDAGAPTCIGVCEPAKSPWWMFRKDDQGRLTRLMGPAATRRQDLPTVWAANGAVYVARIPWLRQAASFVGEGTIGWEMPPERSVDIDTEMDFRLAELLVPENFGQETMESC